MTHGGRFPFGRVVVLLLAVHGVRAPTQDVALREPIAVVATLPWIAALAEEIGGERVRVQALAPPGEDPHEIAVTPGQTRLVREARLVLENGLGLEHWVERLLASAGNPLVMPGTRGHAVVTTGMLALEVPDPAAVVPGAHVHAAGNPHVWLDPVNLKTAARNVERALTAVSLDDAEHFRRGRAAFEARLSRALYGDELIAIVGVETLDRLHRQRKLAAFLDARTFDGAPLAARAGGWTARALTLRRLPLVTFHRTWSYLEAAFGLRVVGTIEEKPGVKPSPAHLERLKDAARKEGVRIVASPPYYPRRTLVATADLIGAAALVLPTQPGESPDAHDLLALFDAVFAAIEAALRGEAPPLDPGPDDAAPRDHDHDHDHDHHGHDHDHDHDHGGSRR